MSFSRRVRSTFAFALLAIAASVMPFGSAALAATPSTKAERIDVRIAYTAGLGTLPVRIAQQRGYFAKHGITARVTQGNDFPTWLAAVGRQYDIVMTTGPLMLSAAAAGVKATFVSGIVNDSFKVPVTAMVTIKPVRNWRELEGKTVGTPALAGYATQAVKYLVKHAGGDPSAVKFVQVGFPMEPQLRSGNVFAVISASPFFNVAKAQGGVTIGKSPALEAAKLASNVTSVPSAGFASSSSWAKSHPRLIAAWRASLNDAMAYIKRNPAASKAYVQKWLNMPASVLNVLPFPDYTSMISPTALLGMAKIAHEVGGLPKVPKISPLVLK